ncbi:MAG: type VII secretion protein EccCa [Streptosporangiales bacterium]|nr:type VII secretion protein EccCa [Streptosporangiales bacterium]
MGTNVIHRPARTPPPAVESEEIQLAEPPKLDNQGSGHHGILGGSMGVGGLASLGVAFSNPQRPLMVAISLVVAIVFILMAVVIVIAMRSGPKKQLRHRRERYLDYVDGVRQRLRFSVAAQRDRGRWLHPEPERLVDVAGDETRRWERRIADADFLSLRVGTGNVPLELRVSFAPQQNPLEEHEPVSLAAAKQLVERRTTLDHQPVTLDLAKVGMTSVVGDFAAGRALLRSLVCQAATFHPPENLRIAVVRSQQTEAAWNFVKWLPHVHSSQVDDGLLPGRLVAGTLQDLAEIIEADIEQRVEEYRLSRGHRPVRTHLLVVIDGEHLPVHAGIESPDQAITLGQLGIHVVQLVADRRNEPGHVDVRVTIGPDGTAHRQLGDGPTTEFAADLPEVGAASALARRLSPLRLAADDAPESVLASDVSLPEVLGVSDVGTIDPLAQWTHLQPRDVLRVSIGVTGSGRPLVLDLKESAAGGMGPHGLVVGATGSGKSEFLRTLVSSLAVKHHPELLAMVLVDYKGGATFAGTAELPHLAGMITNLQDDLALVDRMRDALYGEMLRRQEVLKRAGNLPNVATYHRVREQRPDLPPLPYLLVIIDEFSELLTAKPDFAELFVAIGRIGRSIGMNLLLATQRLEVGKIRGLESHLSYRVGLRTFSESESREAIGTSDAYHLPPEPGSGYLQVDTTVYERFKAAYVSGTYEPVSQLAEATATAPPVVPYTAVNGIGLLAQQRLEALSNRKPNRADTDVGEPTVLDALVRQLASSRMSVHKVWLDPMPAMLPLDHLLRPLLQPRARRPFPVGAVLGLIDEPRAQRQRPFLVDLTGSYGNLLIVGAPQSGKSMLLRTMILSAAFLQSPDEISFYIADFGGGGFGALQDLPHVGTVSSRVDLPKVRRMVNEMIALIDRREELFRQVGLDSATAWRQWRAQGNRFPDDPLGDVVFVVDGWGAFKDEFKDDFDFTEMDNQVGEIAARGLSYGVHVVATSASAHEMRPKIQSSFSGRVELRMNEQFDATIDRELMKNLSTDTPGKGIMQDKLYFQGALPRVDGVADETNLAEAQRNAVRMVAKRYPGRATPPIRILPADLAFKSLPPGNAAPPAVAIGMEDTKLEPAMVNLFSADPHLLVFGDSETGKTNTLDVLCRQLMGAYPRDKIGFVLVDFRRSLLDVVPKEYQVAYCTTAPATEKMCRDLGGQLAKRLPPPDLTAAQLRDRSWWQGIEVFMIVDDYDLVATSSANPLLGIADYLPQARDLGFHMVVARRSGGAGRAIYDPLLQRLTDLSTPGLMFSGDKNEGPLIAGVRPQRLPVGRAVWARRTRGPVQVQVAKIEDRDEPDA